MFRLTSRLQARQHTALYFKERCHPSRFLQRVVTFSKFYCNTAIPGRRCLLQFHVDCCFISTDGRDYQGRPPRLSQSSRERERERERETVRQTDRQRQRCERCNIKIKTNCPLLLINEHTIQSRICPHILIVQAHAATSCTTFLSPPSSLYFT